MIPRFTDHSANERTYLAWLRTSIAVIAFGMLIERFDLFLRSIAEAIRFQSGEAAAPPTPPYGRELGLLLVVVGVATMVIATVRYWRRSQRIRAAQEVDFDPRSALLLGAALLIFGGLTLVYVLFAGWS
ncbi:MAG: YidH family protein [Phycisphaerales bacterium]